MHKHDWVAQHSTVTVLEKDPNEQGLVQNAYDEQVQIVETKEHSICNQCGTNIIGNP